MRDRERFNLADVSDNYEKGKSARGDLKEYNISAGSLTSLLVARKRTDP